MMFWHKKEDQDLFIENNVVSIMDLYPTVREFLLKDYDSYDGKSLKHLDENRYIVVENNSVISNQVGIRNNVWVYVDRNNYFIQMIDFNCSDPDKYIKLIDTGTGKEIGITNENKEKINGFRKTIKKLSCDYKYALKYLKQENISRTPFPAELSDFFDSKGRTVKFSDGEMKKLDLSSRLYTQLLGSYYKIIRFLIFISNPKKIKKILKDAVN